MIKEIIAAIVIAAIIGVTIYGTRQDVERESNNQYCTAHFPNVIVKYNPDTKMYALQDTVSGRWKQGASFIFWLAYMPSEEERALEWHSRPPKEYQWPDSCQAKRWLAQYMAERERRSIEYEKRKKIQENWINVK